MPSTREDFHAGLGRSARIRLGPASEVTGTTQRVDSAAAGGAGKLFRALTATDRRLFAAIAGPLLVLYLLTATWSQPYHIDAFSTVLPAWKLGTDGTVLLEDHTALADPDYFRNLGWIVPAEDGVASQYPPGAALVAAPLYSVWPEDAEVVTVVGSNRPDVAPIDVLVPPLGPAAIVAALAVAIAMASLGIAFRRAGASPQGALAAAYLAGLGTSAWSVAADQLWQHGPAMAWIALGVAFAATFPAASGLAFGAAILTRPPTALIAAGTGLAETIRRRSLRPALVIGAGALLGLAAVVGYNRWVFGAWSISGGYGASFTDNALSGDLIGYARNVFLGLFSATRGVLLWSPFLLVLAPGVRAAWRVAPAWARGAAIGGVVYLLLHYKANRFSGGAGFFAYRYPLEALTAAAPLLFLAYDRWVAARPRIMRAFWAMAAISVSLHALGALDLVSM